MKACEEVEVQPHLFGTSALDGGEWSASHPAVLSPGKELPVITGLEIRRTLSHYGRFGGFM